MSESSPIFAVILAAGRGTRMKSNRAKVLHTLCGMPMVNYVIEATRPLLPEGLFVVVGHQAARWNVHGEPVAAAYGAHHRFPLPVGAAQAFQALPRAPLLHG